MSARAGWFLAAACSPIVAIGLWNHDWAVIVAGLVLAAVWPSIAKGVHDV